MDRDALYLIGQAMGGVILGPIGAAVATIILLIVVDAVDAIVRPPK